jgi:SNF2 family DNA or RNA helicase
MEQLEVPLEEFLLSRRRLRALCRDYGVSITEIDDRVRALLTSVQEDLRLLQAARNSAPLSTEEVRQRLAGTGFVRALRTFQERDLSVLLNLAHGANFSVPGAGKTTVEYAIFAAERAAGRVERMLVVAPLSAFSAWIDEAGECFLDPPRVERFQPGCPIPLSTDVLLTNYQRLHGYFAPLSHWASAAPTLIVLDEAHRMKRGRAGEWGTACLNLAFHAGRREVLTGTPAPQSPRDLIALFDYLWPSHAMTVLPRDVAGPPTPDLGHRLAEHIRPYYTRTRKRDLELPRVERRVYPVALTGIQHDIYHALLDQYAGEFAGGHAERADLARMGRVVMYLLEAATNPHLLATGSTAADPPEFQHPPLAVQPGSSIATLIENYNRYETPPKFLALDALIEHNASQDPPRKTLVWSNFVRNLEALRRRLRSYQPALIHGGVPEYSEDPLVLTREREIRRFREDPACLVLLANPAAMSEGISLHHECHDAIYVDRTFNAGVYLQSLDRIHRLGLPPEQETRVTFLSTEGTIDRRVNSRVQQKAELMGAIMDDPDLVTFSLPDEDDVGPVIGPDDIALLLAHLRGEDEDGH